MRPACWPCWSRHHQQQQLLQRWLLQHRLHPHPSPHTGWWHLQLLQQQNGQQQGQQQQQLEGQQLLLLHLQSFQELPQCCRSLHLALLQHRQHSLALLLLLLLLLQ
jgi:hypothetical protein